MSELKGLNFKKRGVFRRCKQRTTTAFVGFIKFRTGPTIGGGVCPLFFCLQPPPRAPQWVTTNPPTAHTKERKLRSTRPEHAGGGANLQTLWTVSHRGALHEHLAGCLMERILCRRNRRQEKRTEKRFKKSANWEILWFFLKENYKGTIFCLELETTQRRNSMFPSSSSSSSSTIMRQQELSCSRLAWIPIYNYHS